MSTAGRRLARGFTLIEVMVSLLILSVMAVMAWQGLDGIVRSREVADAAVQRTLRVQSVMTQWQADMNAVLDTGTVTAFQFDGGTLRLTRRVEHSGMQVVAWALRSGYWVRWAGTPVTTVGQLQEQWQRSMALQGREPGTLAALKGVQQWQMHCYRGGGWSNCQSTGNVGRQPTGMAGALAAALSGREQLPEGVRSIMVLGEDSGFQGSITRMVLLPPQPSP